jgi:transposase
MDTGGVVEGATMTRAHKRYDEDFRREAIDLLMKSGKPLATMAKELGVSEPTLRLWKMKFIHDSSATGQARVQGAVQGLEGENRRLREEVLHLTRQRDILKKAMGILSEPSPNGMP